MSPWLFNIYMGGMIREVNARILGMDLSLVNVEDKSATVCR